MAQKNSTSNETDKIKNTSNSSKDCSKNKAIDSSKNCTNSKMSSKNEYDCSNTSKDCD